MEMIKLWSRGELWDAATNTYKKHKRVVYTFPKEAYQLMVQAATRSLKGWHVATPVPTEHGVDILLLNEEHGRISLDRAKRTLSLSRGSSDQSTIMGMTSFWNGLFRYAYTTAEQAVNLAFREWMEAHDPKCASLLYDATTKATHHAVGASFHLVFGVSGHVFPRLVMKVLWQHLDREVAGLTLKAFGHGATFAQYTRVWQNQAKVEEALRLAPGVLGLWGMALDMLDVEPGYVTDSVLSDVKRAFGLSPRAWRHLLTLKTSSLPREIAKHYEVSRGYGDVQRTPAELLEFLAEVGVWPKLRVFRDSLGILMRATHGPALVAVVKAGYQESLRRPAKTFWSEGMGLVMDWARDPDFTLDKHQRARGWEYFWGKQIEWHAAAQERARRQRELWAEQRENGGYGGYLWRHGTPRGPQTWDSLLEGMTIDGVEVVPLTTSETLAEEGALQDHCVAGYDHACASGYSRIFSLRTEGKRSTLELGRDYRGWRVTQHRGFHNGEISKALEAVGLKVARLYQEAAREASRPKQLASQAA